MSHIYDIVPSDPDERDFKATEPPAERVILPRLASCPNIKPIRDQGQEGACGGFGTSRAVEIVLRYLMGEPNARLSPAFLYWLARNTEGNPSKDTGVMQIRDLLDAALHMGTCPEVFMPYVAGDFATPPSDAAKKAALPFVIGSYEAVTTPSQAMYAIAKGQPLIIGFEVTPEFENVDSTGIVVMPSSKSQKLGGHCICGVSYNQYHPKAKWQFPNQWNTTWGNNGFCYLSDDFLFEPSGPTFERWTIKPPGA